MRARKLNDYGLNEFRNYINNLRSGVEQNIPAYLLDSEQASEVIDIDLQIKDKEFDSRYDMGVYVNELLSGHNIQKYMGDSGFWSWFALLWFEQLCPLKKNKERKPSMDYNYILSEKYNHRPRHAIYMTWQLVNKYGEDVRFLLSKMSARGELIEQMMARQGIFSLEGVMRLSSELYYDPQKGSFKKGATSRTSAGCVTRYISFLDQLELTYNLFSITKDELKVLLPKEFDNFLKSC